MEVDTDQYSWVKFDVTVDDLERLSQEIQRTKEAYPVIALARKLIQHYLAVGSMPRSRQITSSGQGMTTVRWWDQVEKVLVGDLLIVLYNNDLVIRTVEVTDVETAPTGTKIHVFLPEEQKSSTYIKPNDPGKWARIQNRLREKRVGLENSDKIDQILTRFGDKIIAKVETALKVDSRFVRLSGRWFTKADSTRLSANQLRELTWSMLKQNGPLLTSALATAVDGSVEGDSWLFGVYLTLREHPEFFRKVNSGPQPRWELIGPPLGPFTPQHSVYDPETYEVVARVGEEADQRVVNRLWELELLEAVI